MFTVDQIKQAHSQVKSGADFPAYIQDLKRLGVRYYETYVSDGLTDYFGEHDFKTTSPAKYSRLSIEETADQEQFKADLIAHQQGKTDYRTFCHDCAQSGIEKWVVDLERMSCTYFDRAAKEILVEAIPLLAI